MNFSGGSRPWAKGGGGKVLFCLSCRTFFLLWFLLFSPKRRGAGPLDPSPRSVSELISCNALLRQNQNEFCFWILQIFHESCVCLPIIETVMYWRLPVVRSVPLFCSTVQMSSPSSSLKTGLTCMFPLGCCLNLCLSSLFPSVLVHVNLGAGFPSALQLRMPGVPKTRVWWRSLLVKRAVERKTTWLKKN